MEISFTEEEFSNYKVVRGIILSNDYVDYDYYAVYIPKEDKVELYFKNPFDGKYYNVKDIKTILVDILPMPKGRGFLDTNDTCLLK
ncbi:hypothetical protein [Megamonas funiformis]|uniref:hypothetical protein n=1 Tax=Megamonas funiformis TaxID=437897 RepID=UPI003A91E171